MSGAAPPALAAAEGWGEPDARQPGIAAEVPWYLRPFFWNQRRKYGAALEAALLWVRSPRLFLAVAALYGVIDRRGSPPRRSARCWRCGSRG